jgi:hypothetical protein
MILLTIGFTRIFKIYIFPMEVILRILHHIDFRLRDLIVWAKKKSQEQNRFKLLFNIMNKLNINVKVSEELDEKL